MGQGAGLAQKLSLGKQSLQQQNSDEWGVQTSWAADNKKKQGLEREMQIELIGADKPCVVSVQRTGQRRQGSTQTEGQRTHAGTAHAAGRRGQSVLAAGHQRPA